LDRKTKEVGGLIMVMRQLRIDNGQWRIKKGDDLNVK